MKIFEVSIHIPQDSLGKMMAYLADNNYVIGGIGLVEDVPYHKNKPRTAKAPTAKPPRTAHKGVRKAAVAAIGGMPSQFTTKELVEVLAKQGIKSQNIHGVLLTIVQAGIVKRVGKGLYDKIPPQNQNAATTTEVH